MAIYKLTMTIFLYMAKGGGKKTEDKPLQPLSVGVNNSDDEPSNPLLKGVKNYDDGANPK